MPFKISNQQKVNVLGSLIHTAYVDCFLFSDVCWKWFRLEWKWKRSIYEQSVQENEIDTYEEILKDVDNIINEFSDVPEFNFPADTSHFDFDLNPIKQSIFPADTSVQPDLNHNPITNLFFYLAYQFNLISIPIPSTKVLLMYLMTIPLVLHLTICLYANQLVY